MPFCYLNNFALCSMSRTLAAPPISNEIPTPTVNFELTNAKFSRNDFIFFSHLFTLDTWWYWVSTSQIANCSTIESCSCFKSIEKWHETVGIQRATEQQQNFQLLTIFRRIWWLFEEIFLHFLTWKWAKDFHNHHIQNYKEQLKFHTTFGLLTLSWSIKSNIKAERRLYTSKHTNFMTFVVSFRLVWLG